MKMSDLADPPGAALYFATGVPTNEAPQRIAPGASAFVRDGQGRILLEKRADNGFWGMPAGRMEPGESIADTVIRETSEETGLIVRVDRLIGVYSNPALFNIGPASSGGVVQYVNCCFACTIVGGELTISDESTDLGFFPPEALPEPLLKSHSMRIRDALTNQSAAFIR
jgi:8-oxo-dGTP pyrophosphatase MutT (NUDIX family)